MKQLPFPVLIPLLNPNEPDAQLAAVHVHEGQPIGAGDLLCTLETTKSTAEVTAEAAGYVVDLRLQPGQSVRAGDILCYLAAAPDWTPPTAEPAEPAPGYPPDQLPGGLRITQPALDLARRSALDLNRLPAGPLVTAAMVRNFLESASTGLGLRVPPAAFDATAILVYGAGGHGKMLIDLLRSLGTYRIAALIDDGAPPGHTVLGVPVLGGAAHLPELYDQGLRLAVNAVGGIGNLAVRVEIFQRLAEAGFAFPVIIHPAACVERSANLAPGAQVFAHAYVGSEAQIGFGTIVNTGAIISHDCVLGEFTNISPGALLAGEVQVGSGVLVGMGATVNLQVQIGAQARIGNGATVKSDVPAKGVVRAGSIWPE